MKRGKLITLEGCEGAGKTTALKFVLEQLSQWGVSYICTREPGGESNAEKIREILLHSTHLDPKTELLLMFASRNEHIKKVVLPALDKGVWVVSDRYVDASYAYQGGGRELGFEVVEWLDKFIVSECQSDLTLLMDIDPVIGMKRVTKRGNKDRIEKESIEFFYRIRESYLQRAQSQQEKYIVIDAAQKLELVKENILIQLEAHKQRLL